MSAMPRKPVRMNILSVPAHLPIVRAAAQKLCEMVGFDEDAAGGIVLSVDEALANIIKHAYEGAQDKPIEVEMEPILNGQCQGVRITLRDYGKVVDPSQIKSRDLSDVRPGGLGVHIMTRCMDSVEYRHPRGGGTLLIMTKSVPAAVKGQP